MKWSVMGMVNFVLGLTENQSAKFLFCFVSFLSISLETVTKVLWLFVCSPPHLQQSLSEFSQRSTIPHSVWRWIYLVVEIVSAVYCVIQYKAFNNMLFNNMSTVIRNSALFFFFLKLCFIFSFVYLFSFARLISGRDTVTAWANYCIPLSTQLF